MSTRHHVLLACGSDWQAPARLPRLFQRAGCHVTVLASPEWGITKTKFVDEIVAAPTSLDPYVDALRSHLALNDRKYSWIIAVDDPLIGSLVEQDEWTADILPVSSNLKGALASKAGFVSLAKDLSLPVPEQCVCESIDEALLAARALGYPLVMKLSASYAGIGVRKVDDDSELIGAWSELRADHRVVLQRYVEGQLGNTAALFSKGRLLASMSAFKSRTWPGAFGPSSARRFVHDTSIDGFLERFGSQSEYDGFCAFDWILGSDNALKLIELNARPVPALHMAKHVGVDFSEAIAVFLNARSSSDDVKPEPQRPLPIRNAAIFPMFPEDFQRAIAEADQDGLARFLPDGLGHDDIPWDDPPFLAHVLRRRTTRKAFDRLFPIAALGIEGDERNGKSAHRAVQGRESTLSRHYHRSPTTD